MDIDNIGGSTLQAMAEAVENAVVVLICYSRKYKESENCRLGKDKSFATIFMRIKSARMYVIFSKTLLYLGNNTVFTK
jgi:hypothetical protein